jgi:DNA-binding CsgD family transcriptional regulator
MLNVAEIGRRDAVFDRRVLSAGDVACASFFRISPFCEDDAGRGVSSMVGAARSPMVGRAVALSTFQQELRRVSNGAGRCVVVQAPIGGGKTRFLEHAAELAAASEMTVVCGRAGVLDRAGPLATLASVRVAGEGALDLTGLAAGGEPVELVGELAARIERSARRRPVVVVLDDVQYADPGSALLLDLLVPRLREVRALWLLGAGPVPVDTPAQKVLERLVGDGARRVTLDRLAPAAVAELCARMLPSPPAPTVRALINRAEGSPFLVEQILLAVVDGATCAELPTKLSDAVHRRLRQLSDDARMLLQAGAVLGRPFTVHEAAGLTSQPLAAAIAAATEVVAAGVLRDRDGELDFQQELTREAVYYDVVGPVRLAMHREAARLVREDGRPELEVAAHLALSGRPEPGPAPPPDSTGPSAPADRGPDETAANGVVIHVLEQLGEHGADRPRLIAEAVRVLASAGRFAEARELGQVALAANLDSPAETHTLLALAEAARSAGDFPAAAGYSRRALDRPGVPAATRSRLLAVQAFVQLTGTELGPGGPGADRGRSVPSLTELLRDYAADVPATGLVDPSCPPQPWLWLARGLAGADRFAEAEVVYSAVRRDARRLGADWSPTVWYYHHAELCAAAGRLGDAEGEAREGLRTLDRVASPELGVALRALLAQLAIRRNDLELANTHLSEVRRVDVPAGVAAVNLAWARAAVEEAGGDPFAAVELLWQVCEEPPLRTLLLTEQPHLAPALVRLALRVGAQTIAEGVAATARCMADHDPEVASLTGAAAHAEGLLRQDVQALRGAVLHYRGSARPMARASAIEDAARAERADGNLDAAAALLREAVETYSRIDAGYDASRARRLLCQLHLDGGGAQSRPSGGWPSLTSSELRVVELIAQGMTNREAAAQLFLSPHTVDSHLRHVFTKLDINSRVELTRQYLAHTAEPPNARPLRVA